MALFDFNAIPGLGVARETVEKMFLWGRHEQAYFRSIILKSTTTDPGNTNSIYELRPGLVLAQYTSGANNNKWVAYNNTGTDGSQFAQGILAHSVKMLDLSGSTSDKVAVAIVGGPVKGNQLLYVPNGSTTVTNTGLDPQGRVQLARNFTFDDDLVGQTNSFKNTVTKGVTGSAGTYSVLVADSGTIFTTTGGDTTSTTFTLPALLDANSNPVAKGVHYRFFNTVNLNMVVQASGTDKIYVKNDLTHGIATFSTTNEKTGAVLDITTNEAGTAWLGVVGNGVTVTMS